MQRKSGKRRERERIPECQGREEERKNGVHKGECLLDQVLGYLGDTFLRRQPLSSHSCVFTLWEIDTIIPEVIGVKV